MPMKVIDDLPDADHVIAADSGYVSALALGLGVDVVIGDFDSLPPETDLESRTEVLRYPTDKEATDLELAFEFALGNQPDRIVLVGGEGGRFDHEMATTTLLCAERWRSVPEIEWVRTDSHCYVVRRTIRIQGDPGATISLVAIDGTARGVSTRGLNWGLDSETIEAGSTRGVSNRFKAPEATIKVEDGVLLAIVPDPSSP